MFGLCAGERLCERVGDHIFGRAVVYNNLSSFYDVTDEMEADIDVLCSCMELLVASECYGGLGIGVECHGILGFVDFGDKLSKPDSFLSGVSSGHVFGFSGRQRNNGLALRAPGDSASVNEKSVAGDGVSVFVRHSVGVGVSGDRVLLLAVD